MSRESSPTWLSAHLYFGGELYGRQGDNIILHVFEPFVTLGTREGWLVGHFFVRYHDDGPHIRLRYRGRSADSVELLRDRLVDHVQSVWYSLELGSTGPDGPLTTAPVLRWITYRPEVDRYGGQEAMAVAEQCFEASSTAAFGLLRGLDAADRTARLGKALLAMLVLLHVFTRDLDRATALARKYRRSNLGAFARAEHQDVEWLEAFDAGYDRQATTLPAFVAEAWQRLEEGESLYAELDHYRQDLQPVRESLAQLCSEGRVRHCGRDVVDLELASGLIIPSYIHMTSNRLGITIRDEAYLSHLIERALRDIRRPSPGAIV